MQSISVFVCVCAVILAFILYNCRVLYPTISYLIEIEKCPACFGTSLCPAFHQGLIRFNGFNSFEEFFSLFGSRNVKFALYGDERVVLKKLGHNWELEELDKTLCGGEICDVSALHWNVNDVRMLIAELLSRMKTQQLNSFHLCPSIGNLDKLLGHILQNNKDTDLQSLYTHIWTLLLLNAEPLLLQILTQEEGWPVPKYYGACGRVVVEEYVGPRLLAFHASPWLTRAKLAHQLLVAATNFTHKHPDFGFYLTDISMDNVAVDPAGTVKFIDLENVVIVDKNMPEQGRPMTWYKPHVSDVYDCSDCFAFSADDICSHQVSDHNYFAVCQQLLASEEGLLHDIPLEEESLHPQLPVVLQECVQPNEHGDRFIAAQKLTQLLAGIINNANITSKLE